MNWKDIKDRKLAEQRSLLEPYLVSEEVISSIADQNDIGDLIDSSSLITPHQKKITNLEITELLSHYQAAILSVKKVVTAFCFRATLAHQLTNCLTEVRFPEALQEAEQLDEYFKTHGKLKGPLHGIVVSLKDNINVAGLASSMGFIGTSIEKKNEDAAMVTAIKRLGGIIIAKTNTSPGMMYSETTNMLWGRTLNPWSRKLLNVGGSSGGEGALAALKGSNFGIGSDIGGSVRHPAGLNLVYGLKPLSGRFPKYGTVSGQAGQESIVSVYGVMSYSLANVEYVTKSIISSKPYYDLDPSCIPLEYRKFELDQSVKLNIGILTSDGTTSSTSPVIRGLETVKQKLLEKGHNVIDWEDTYFTEIKDTIYPFYGANGYAGIKKLIEQSGEPLDPHLKYVDDGRDMPVSELWELHKKRTELTKKYLDFWNGKEDCERLDAIVSSVSPFPGCLIDKIVPQPVNAIWNALDYSSITVPVTRCNVSKDKPIDKKNNYISEVDKFVHETYANELEKFHGGPVSVQVICNKLEEEKCLALAKYLNGLLLENDQK